MDRGAERARDAELVAGVRAGDQLAFGRLYDVWFDRSWDLARRIVRDPDAAADVAQEAMLTAWRRLDELDDPASFGGWLLRITRNRAIDATRRRRDLPAPEEVLAMTGAGGARLSTVDDPAELAADRGLVDLVWAAADGLGERDAQVLDLSVRFGFEPSEIAAVMDVSRVHAAQLVSRSRKRLERAMRARVLWREGEPVCEGLATALERAAVVRFDPGSVEVIDRHARRCDGCQERRRTRMAPAALFAAVPLGAPDLLRRRAAERLATEGVPMAGSTSLGGPGPTAVGTAPTRGRRHRLGAVAAVGVAIVVGVLSWWLVAGGDDEPEQVLAADLVTVPETTTSAPPTTTAPTTETTTAATATTDAVAGPPDTTPLPSVAPPPTPPLPTTTTTASTVPADSAGPTVTAEHAVVVFDVGFLAVQANATDPSGVSRVEVWFSPSPAGNLSRVESCTASACSWQSGGHPIDTEVRYQVRALDGAGNWAQSPVRSVVLQ